VPSCHEVVLNSRSFSEFYVIDHSKTTEELRGPDGDFLYRFGSPSNYASEDQVGAGAPGAVALPSQMDPSLDQIYGAHDIHWISEGLPGAGNFLIFDNGVLRPTYQNSAVLEINPYDVNGDYVRELDAGYKPTPMLYPGAAGSGTFLYGLIAMGGSGVYMRPSNQIVWAFTGNSWNFFGPHISGCERQPNGNTLVCDGPNGHFFEVTTEGEVVWEYTSPLFGQSFTVPGLKLFGNQVPGPIGISTTIGLTEGGTPLIGGTGGAFQDNSVFRVYKYSPDFPAFAGKDLSSMGTLTGRISGTANLYPEPPPAPTGWGTSGLSSGEGGGGAAGGSGTGGGTGY
jgi:hypothetical protein